MDGGGEWVCGLIVQDRKRVDEARDTRLNGLRSVDEVGLVVLHESGVGFSLVFKGRACTGG